MLSKSLYISPINNNSGILFCSIGFMEFLKRKFKKVAYFTPILSSQEQKYNLDVINDVFDVNQKEDEYWALNLEQTQELISKNKIKDVYESIIKKYKELECKYDFVLIAGIEKSCFEGLLSNDINIQICKNLNSSMIAMINAYSLDVKQIQRNLSLCEMNIKQEHCKHYCTIVNKIQDISIIQNNTLIKKGVRRFFIPSDDTLSCPTVSEIKTAIDAKLIFPKKSNIQKVVKRNVVCAMQIEHVLPRIKDGDLLITSFDRIDVLLGVISATYSTNFPSVSAIVLSGAKALDKHTEFLLDGLRKLPIPILFCPLETYQTSLLIDNVKTAISSDDNIKINIIKDFFENYIGYDEFEKSIQDNTSDILTPSMFKYNIVQKAKQNKKTIVLPESMDDRILQAVAQVLSKDILDIVLLGEEEKILQQAKLLDLDISKAKIINHHTSPLAKDFAKEFYSLRKDKGVSKEVAKDTLKNVNYFATMMVHMGHADGMLSGATHTTAETIRPALQIIKTKKGISTASSVFFMCLDDRVLVFADCAIVQNPTSEQLAQIAISSHKTALQFDINPLVAMLSYSSGSSGAGKDVQKVVDATKYIQDKYLDIQVEGPLQYDSATSEEVAKMKMPNSKVAGKASVLIFPDLNTGNNTYKAVQRSANAVAIGPILQGLNKPVNDLSRGCSVEDIINTMIITALQG